MLLSPRFYSLAYNAITFKSDTHSLYGVRRWLAALPPALVVAAACRESWHDSGSIAAAAPHGFLPYALFATAVLAGVLLLRGAAWPRGRGLAALGLLLALAAWATASLAWAPMPSLARDEGLLTAFYAVALALPLVSLHSAAARTGALALVTSVLGCFTLAVAVRVGFGTDAASLFPDGRLSFPITYANAQAALVALGFWPALLLASRERGSVAARALALGGASAFLGATTLAQSKGAMLGLVVAAAVLLAVSPQRLRLLLPLAVCAAIEALAFTQLTAPYRDASRAAAHGAGRAVLVGAAVAALAGASVAIADRRLKLAARTVDRVAVAIAVAAALAALGGCVAFATAVPHPEAWAQDRWAQFTHLDPNAGGSTHLLALGSNRYDFWRVSLLEWERHPIAGCGARCFGPAYLQLGRSAETPARAHSLPLEVLGEQGLIGFALLAGALVSLAGLLGRGARAGMVTAGAGLGAFTTWLVQASVDWTWTFPAVTVPALVLAGVGAAATGTRPLAPHLRRAWAPALVALALVVFAPPWVAQWLTDRALAGGGVGSPSTDLRWARRLDPVSTAPVIAQAALAPTADAEIELLRQAARMEPHVVQTQYFLGSALLNTGRRDEARAVFQRALRLDPRNALVARALRLAG